MARPKAWINFWIDIASLGAFLFLVSTGLLLKLQLPPGSGHRGLSVWGMTRHEWGTLHFWVSVALVALIVAHVVLHANWLLTVIGGGGKGRRGHWRLWLGGLAAVLLFGGTLSPLLGPVETPERPPTGAHDHGEGRGEGQRRRQRGGNGGTDSPSWSDDWDGESGATTDADGEWGGDGEDQPPVEPSPADGTPAEAGKPEPEPAEEPWP